MKKLMISQPMRGLTELDIKKTRDRAIEFANNHNFDFINTLLDGQRYNTELMEKEKVNIPLYYLADSLRLMSNCNIVYFAKGWEHTRSCRIEHLAAKEYGLEIIYEEELKEELHIDHTIY